MVIEQTAMDSQTCHHVNFTDLPFGLFNLSTFHNQTTPHINSGKLLGSQKSYNDEECGKTQMKKHTSKDNVIYLEMALSV